MSTPKPTLMWEAAATPGQHAQLLAWVRATAAEELGDARPRRDLFVTFG